MTTESIIIALFSQHACAWYVAGNDTQRNRVVAVAALVLEPLIREREALAVKRELDAMGAA